MNRVKRITSALAALALLATGAAVGATLPAAAGTITAEQGHGADHGPRDSGGWAGTWEAAPQPPQQAALTDTTLRLVVHTSLGGEAVRIRVSNRFGTEPLQLGAAFAAPRTNGADVGRGARLTFGGRSAITVGEGSDVVSDPAPVAVRGLSDLAVSLYVESSGPPTTHADFGNSHQTSYTATGDHAGDPAGSAFTSTTTSWPLLSGVSVEARHAASVVTLGDSITDGTASTTDADARYPDFLARRLAAQPASRRLGVVNAGIGGNELLRTSGCCGSTPSALARLDQDVIAQDGVHSVIVLEGINDIGGIHHADAASLIAGLQQVSVRLHAQGIRVLGGTITPSYGRPGDYGTQATEDVRQEVNRWIRTSRAFDAVVDFDAALRDSRDPRRLQAGYDSGDHLHPNDAGYRAMAAAVPLAAL